MPIPVMTILGILSVIGSIAFLGISLYGYGKMVYDIAKAVEKYAPIIGIALGFMIVSMIIQNIIGFMGFLRMW